MSHLLVHCILDLGWRCQFYGFQTEQSALHQRFHQAVVPALVQTAECKNAVKSTKLQGRVAGQSRDCLLKCNTARSGTAHVRPSITFSNSSRIRKRGRVGAALCAMFRKRASEALGQRHFPLQSQRQVRISLALSSA